MQKILASLTVLLAFAAVDARADLLINGSFENTGGTFVGDGNKVDQVPSGSSLIPGWTTTNGVPTAWIENGSPYGISSFDGDFFLDLTNYANVGTYGGVTQSFATVAGTKYVATFYLGYGGASRSFGGPVTVSAAAGDFSGAFTSGSGTPNPAVWDLETFNFTATSALTDLTIIGLSTTGGQYIGLDDVHVETAGTGAVPEPSTTALLLTGIGFLGWVARRRSARGENS